MLQEWKEKLGLEQWDITIQEINPKQVVYPDDCVGDERFFIGVQPNHERQTATIYHDIPLYEEALVHELMHIKYPNESEEWVNNKTNKILIKSKSHGTIKERISGPKS